jgi:type I site-specific restriction endonuclease
MEAMGQTSGHLESLISYCIYVRQCLQTFDEREKRLALEALDIRVTWTPNDPLTIQGSIPLSDIVPVPSGQVTPQLMSRAAEPEKPVYGSQPVRAQRHPLLYPYCPASICGKEPHYFQEVAIRRVIECIVAGQKWILLTMATGTGKTFTAFQIVWKLKKSGWLRKPVLFIADRKVLRDQAYNTFAPFVNSQSDPRNVIGGGGFNAYRDLYFALHQALDTKNDGEPLFKRIPPDFFGLIIIDECHRSGFGKWNDILQHFPEAIQFGMTATPKQNESIDTYAYFRLEEPEISLDPDDPSMGTWKPPAYLYSLGQGIEDGFLATYKVHFEIYFSQMPNSYKASCCQ